MNTKKLLSIFIFTCISSIKAQTYEWAFQGGGGGGDFGRGIVTDENGFVYTVADYMGNANYGNEFLSGGYFGNSLFAKHDSSGNVIWVQKITGVHCYDISIDKSSNCYITGYCGTATFYGNNSSINFTSLGDGEAFIAKYNSSGDILWVKRYGDSINADCGNAIKTDKDGNSYVAGLRFHHDGSLGYPVHDFFLLKYDSLGNILWTQTTNWTGTANPTSLDVDSEGNCFVTGILRDSVTFAGTVLHATSPGTSIFLVKYDVNGNVVWAKKEGSNSDEANGISLDKAGNIFITGKFTGPSTFGSTTLSSANGGMFIAKYNSNGTNIWAKYSSAITGIGVASSGSLSGCFVTGWMYGTSSFGEGSNIVSLTSAKANREIFVAKYNTYGDLEWAVSPSGGAWEANQVMAIHVDDKNNCYITGGCSGSTIFGNDSLFAPYSTSGYFDIFLVKLNDKSTVTTGLTMQEQPVDGISVYPNPTSGNLILTIYNIMDTGSLLVKLADVLGKEVYSDIYRREIDVTSLEQGVYFLSLYQNNKFLGTKKIVKQ